jgi:ABC-type Fe3+/spermidine/putrescine transport system ATPase subunit
VRVRTEIRLLQQELGKTAIYVTHDQEEALAISDRIAVMEGGRIQQIGSPLEIYHHPANRFVADFVGLANFVDAERSGPGQVRVGERTFAVADQREGAGHVTMVLRPEALRLHGSRPERGGNVLTGRVRTSSFLGTLARYWIDAEGLSWIVDVPSPGETMLSGQVFVEVPPERIHLLNESSA